MVSKDKSSKRGGGRRSPSADADSILIERLAKLMNERGLRARSLSHAAKLSTTYVNDVLKQKNRNPSVQALQALAGVLETSVAYLCGETDTPHKNSSRQGVGTTLTLTNQLMPVLMPVLGVAETGAFRKLSGSTMQSTVFRPVSQVYPQHKHFVITVGDDTMAGAKVGAIVPGMELICVDMRDANLTVESGKLYVIRRTPDGGKTHETLVRRAQVYRDRTVWLSEPVNSKNAETITVSGHVGTDPKADIYAVGLVVGLHLSVE